MQKSREYHCPDQDCDWHMVDQPTEIVFEAVPWKGTIDATVKALTEEHYGLVDSMMEAHIREFHDPIDPYGWAEKTASALKANS